MVNTHPRHSRTAAMARFAARSVLAFLSLLALPACAAARADAETGGSGDEITAAGGGPVSASVLEKVREARDSVFPALVNVSVVTVNHWDGRERKGRGVGSGTIISADGYVLTNQHVVDNGIKFECTLSDKQEISAELVGEDPLTDLAVLKINLDELKDPKMKLSVGSFGDSSGLQIGDYVMAMGSPFALSRSVTLGVVSNTERVFSGASGNPGDLQLEEGQQTGLFNRWIQHDALINPGNSGGPLVDLAGKIIGVNTRGGSAMGFAIPSNLAREIADGLIKDGEITRSWFGVSLRPTKDTGFEKGVLLTSVVENGPADKAGLKAGDLIMSMGGEELEIRFAEDAPALLKRMADYPLGSEVAIAYERDGGAGKATITTEKLTKEKGDQETFHAWGLSAYEITDKVRRDWRFEDKTGALVTGVRGGGPAQVAEPPLGYGDVIRSIDGRKVENLEDLVEAYKEIMKADPLPEYLRVEFDRRGKVHLTLIKPKPEKDEDPPREVAKAWIGIAMQPVLHKLARNLGHEDQLGFRITRVYPGTLAEGSELKVGDVIVGLNGQPMAPRGLQDAELFNREVRRLEIDDSAVISILRDGEPKDVTVTLERTRIGPEEALRDRNRDFELTVREVTFFDRDENRWDEDTKGVIVEDVEQAGWAGLGGIRGRMLIQRIGSHEVKGLKSYREAMDEVTAQQPERVVVVALVGSQTLYFFLEPDWKPTSEGEDDAEAAE